MVPSLPKHIFPFSASTVNDVIYIWTMRRIGHYYGWKTSYSTKENDRRSVIVLKATNYMLLWTYIDGCYGPGNEIRWEDGFHSYLVYQESKN